MGDEAVKKSGKTDEVICVKTVTENWVIEAPSVGTVLAYLETIMAYSHVRIRSDKTFLNIRKNLSTVQK